MRQNHYLRLIDSCAKIKQHIFDRTGVNIFVIFPFNMLTKSLGLLL